MNGNFLVRQFGFDRAQVIVPFFILFQGKLKLLHRQNQEYFHFYDKKFILFFYLTYSIFHYKSEEKYPYKSKEKYPLTPNLL